MGIGEIASRRMTTRQFLRRRWNQTVFSAIALFAAAGLLQLFLVTDERTSDYFLRATVLLAFACLLWAQVRTPCLNCRRPIGMGALWWVNNPLTAQHTARCPHCNVSIDREMPDRRDL